MTTSAITLIVAIVGLAATFMPWVHFPKGNTDLYGYVGDGLITGFVFILVGLLSGIEIFKHKQIVVFKIINAILGLLMLIAGISKIYEIEFEKTNFESDNPFIGAAFAGFTQGSGLYILVFAGLGVMLFSLSGLYAAIKNSSSSSSESKWPLYIPLILITLMAGVLFFNYSGIKFSGIPTKESMEQTFKNDIEKMGQCLIDRDFDCFIEYNHPMIVQSYGTKQKMKDILNQALRAYKDQKGAYKNIKFVNIVQTEQQGNNIQSIINQDVTIKTPTGDITEEQKVLAISDDNGNTWHYINLSGMTKERLLKFYPAFNPKLNF